MSEIVWSELMPLARQVNHVFVAGFGEPLTNPRCLDLLQQLNDEGIKTTLTTNGLALNPATAGRLAGLPFLVHINVSIDSPDQTTYREIRGGNLDRALRGLRNLVAAMPDTSRITVSSVAMRQNVAELADFPPILSGLGITTFIVQGLNDYTAYSESQSLVGANRLSEHLSRLRSACEESGTTLVLTTPERTLAEESERQTVLAHYYQEDRAEALPQTRQCMLPWEQPYIDKDGRVFPCCIAGASSQSELGRLGTRGHGTLREIWNGSAYQDFRRALLDPGTTPGVCRTCTVVPNGPHPLRAYHATLEGSRRILTRDGAVTARFRNTGSQTWSSGSVRVGTTMPRERASEFEHATWLSSTKPCAFQERSVAPGESATFAFQAYLPPTRTMEEFQLVVDDTRWLPNTRFTVVTPTAARHPVRTAHWVAGRTRQALRGRPRLKT